MEYCCLSRGWLWGLRVGTGLLAWEMLVFQTFGFSFAVIGLLAPLLGFSVARFSVR